MVRTQPERASKATSRPAKATKTNSNQQGTQLILQKTTNETASSSNAQTVSIAQSLEVVQVLLHSCLSSLASTRNLFPDSAYQKRFYHAVDSHWSYEDFASGKHTYDPNVTDMKMQGLAMWAFNRGVCKRVDQFLQLVENGVFDALRRGYLESLLVIIREQSEDPDNMLERYTFTFERTEIPSGSRAISGIVMSDSKGTQVRMRDARRSLSDFVRKLINLCYNMPALPDKAKLSMEITYTENCPPEYHAPHFPHSGTETARFPDDERCEKHIVGVGRLNAGFHSVALKVSHVELAPGDFDDVASHFSEGSRPSGEPIPAGLQYGPATNKFDDIDTSPPAHKDTVPPPSSQLSRTPPNLDALNHTQNPIEQDRHFPLQDQTITGLIRSPASQQASPLASGQRSEAVEATLQLRTRNSIAASRRVSTRAADEREQLRNMLQPVPTHSDVQGTQIVAADTQLSENIEQQIAHRMMFSTETIEQLDLDRSCMLPERRSTRLHRQPDVMTTSDPIYSVKCECGFGVQELVMLHCGFCNTLQHAVCYGYDKGVEDERIPEIQVCYSCLVTRDDEVLSKLKRHAFYRRAIYPLLQKSFDSSKHYAKEIGYNLQDVGRIVKKLDGDRLLATSGSKKSKGQIALAPDMHDVAVKTYFDPSYLITGHMEAPAPPQKEGHGRRRRGPTVAEVGSRSVGKRGLGVDETAHIASTPKRTRRSGRPGFDFDTANYPSPLGGA